MLYSTPKQFKTYKKTLKNKKPEKRKEKNQNKLIVFATSIHYFLMEVKEMIYYVKLMKQTDGSYLAEFPELEGCLTEGTTKDEVLKNAKEALKRTY